MRAPLHSLLPLCLLLTAPLAGAQGTETVEFAPGFLAGPELSPGGFGHWVDRGYGVIRFTAVGAPSNTESAVRCSDYTVYPQQPRGPDLVLDRTSEDPNFTTQYETVVTGYPGQGHFYLVSHLDSVQPRVVNANLDAGALAGKVARQLRIYRAE